MNIRKPTDYSAMYAVLDQLMETRTVPVPQALHRRFLEIRLRSVRDFFASADMDAAQLEAVLERIRPEAEAQARQLEETYEARHTDYARQLFQAVTKG